MAYGPLKCSTVPQSVTGRSPDPSARIVYTAERPPSSPWNTSSGPDVGNHSTLLHGAMSPASMVVVLPEATATRLSERFSVPLMSANSAPEGDHEIAWMTSGP